MNRLRLWGVVANGDDADGNYGHVCLRDRYLAISIWVA